MLLFMPWTDHDRKRTARARIRHGPLPHPRQPWRRCPRRQRRSSCPGAGRSKASRVRERFGPIGDGVADGLRLRHDHGSNYLADDFQQEVAFFGIESSPSFVRAPEGNGVAERFIRT